MRERLINDKIFLLLSKMKKNEIVIVSVVIILIILIVALFVYFPKHTGPDPTDECAIVGGICQREPCNQTIENNLSESCPKGLICCRAI